MLQIWILIFYIFGLLALEIGERFDMWGRSKMQNLTFLYSLATLAKNPL